MLAARKVLTFKLRGDFTDADIPGIRGHICDGLAGGTVHMLLDLTWVRAMTPGLFQVLEERAQHLKSYRGGLWLVGLPERLRKQMILCLPHPIPISRLVETEDEAIDEIKACP